MATNEPRQYKDLTPDDLFRLLADLPEDVQADDLLLKRGCCRWLLRSPAEFYFPDEDGTEAKEYVSIRDISMTGVGLHCKRSIRARTEGELVLPLEDGYYKTVLKVVHCTQTVGGYKVGCHLQLAGEPVMLPTINRALLTQEEFERSFR